MKALHLNKSIALLGFVATIAAYLSGVFASYRPFLGDIEFEKESSITVSQTKLFGDAATSFAGAGSLLDIEAIYHKQMRLNDSSFLVLQCVKRVLSFELEKGETQLPLSNLSREVACNLEAAGFEIAPQARITKRPPDDFPLSFVWTITPEKEGKYVLLLDISNLLLQKEEDDLGFITQFAIEKQEVPISDLFVLQMPVKAIKTWEISRRTYNVMRYTALIVGILLLFPLIVSLVRCKKRRK